MGRSASIDFKVQEFPSRTLDILRALLDMGWSYDDHGHISYLPIGDHDDCDWQWAGLDEWEMVCSIIGGKEKHGEMIGVSLVWGEGSMSGGLFLLKPNEGLIMVVLNMNRRRIAEAPDVTDYSWYLQRLVPSFERAGLRIESIQCCDHARAPSKSANQ